jgi:hypothetical protein
MDLTNIVSSIQQAQTSQAIQTSVAKKVMDAQRQDGAEALQLLRAAGNTGGAGDALVAQATGLGGQVDTYA